MVKKVKFNLTDSQRNKLAHAIKANTGVDLKLSKDMITANGVPLILTESDIKKLSDGGTHSINFPASRVKSMVKDGGILPLIPIIGGLTAALGLTGAAAGTAAGITKTIREAKQINLDQALNDAKIRAYELAAGGKGHKGGMIPSLSSIASAISMSKRASTGKGNNGGFLPLPLLAAAPAAAALAIQTMQNHKTIGKGNNGGFLPLPLLAAAAPAAALAINALQNNKKIGKGNNGGFLPLPLPLTILGAKWLYDKYKKQGNGYHLKMPRY